MSTSITLVKVPQRGDSEINLVSRWSSNRLPYIFEFKRIDNILGLLFNDGGFVKATILANDITGLSIGTVITIISNNKIYDGVKGTITAAYTSGSSYTYILTDIPYIANDTGAIVLSEMFQGYRAFMNVIRKSPSTNVEEKIGTVYGTFDKFGNCVIDIRSLLTYEMKKINLFKFDTFNEKDINTYFPFRISYNAQYLSSNNLATVFPNDIFEPNTFYSVDGVKNLLERYGQNFADYVPHSPESAAKFLTEFITPTYFIDYPFSLSFIFPRELALEVNFVTLEQENFNAAGVLLNVTDDNLDMGKSEAINFLRLQGSYGGGVDYTEVWLQANGVAGDLYVEDDYVDTDYVEGTLPIGGSAIVLTERKKVYIDSKCRKNPIYLMWRNSLGGWDYWLFDNNSELQNSSKQNNIYSLYIKDIELSPIKEKITSTEQQEVITVGDLVLKTQIKGIMGIEKSPQVYMLKDVAMLDVNPELAWKGVTIIPKGFKYSALAENIEVEISFKINDYYTVSN